MWTTLSFMKTKNKLRIITLNLQSKKDILDNFENLIILKILIFWNIMMPRV